MLSGNIEAHESVRQLSKTVQSRIVELPFNEGQWVKQGTVVARADDSDYAQQVAVAEAGLAVQQRQHDSALQNREAALRTVNADEAELALRQVNCTDLRQKDFVSAAALDQAEAAYKQAEAVCWPGTGPWPPRRNATYFSRSRGRHPQRRGKRPAGPHRGATPPSPHPSTA